MAGTQSKAVKAALKHTRALIQATYRLQESYKASLDRAAGRISSAEAVAKFQKLKRAVRKIERCEVAGPPPRPRR